MEIFTFCCKSQLIFNILLFMKIIQIENIIKKPNIYKYQNHWNTVCFSMIWVILGAQKSPPKTYFFVMSFLKITYWSKLKTFNFHMFYNEFTSPIHKIYTPKNCEKTNKIQTPLHVTENRPSSKTSVFVTYLRPKSDDWTPPRDPPRSPQKVPKPTRGAPETPQSSPRALQDPQDALGVTKPHENQQKRTQNNIKHLKTTETTNIPTLSVQFSCSIS